MFEKVFRRGTRVTEARFHNELEQRLLVGPEIGGRLTRRDPVAGGFDDLLHDDVIAELKVSRGKRAQDRAARRHRPVWTSPTCCDVGSQRG